MIDHYPILCLLAPLAAIILSFITRKVHFSLATGILIGFVLIGLDDTLSLKKSFTGLFDSVLFDAENLKILTFTGLISMMINVMVYNGNIDLIGQKLLSLATNRKSAQLMAWFTGLLIFFDDYANTLIVGNTLRPITDRYKVSREKLAYIVDSTAAPVAAIALVSTWIGTEVREISKALGDHLTASPYAYFLNSLSYSFYPVLTLVFILITILSGREFGPMLKAKPTYQRQEPKKNQRKHCSFLIALLPIIVLVVVSLGLMCYTGYLTIGDGQFTLSEAIGEADTINSLLMGSIASFLVANLYAVSNLSQAQFYQTIWADFKKILLPLSVLLVAWSLGYVITELNTGDKIAQLLPSNTTPYILPAAIFLTSAMVSFATGSSFSTMGIVYPIALSIVLSVCAQLGFSADASNEILYHSIASVLAGAVFGDHCSPISDTTILSSIASKCNHIQHVRTQLPYALSVGGVSLFLSLTLANVGLPPLIVFGVGIFILYMIVMVFGRTPRF